MKKEIFKVRILIIESEKMIVSKWVSPQATIVQVVSSQTDAISRTSAAT